MHVHDPASHCASRTRGRVVLGWCFLSSIILLSSLFTCPACGAVIEGKLSLDLTVQLRLSSGSDSVAQLPSANSVLDPKTQREQELATLQAAVATFSASMDKMKGKQGVVGRRSKFSAIKQSDSKGIVIAAGRRYMFANLYINLRIMREQLNCTLPVEVVYQGVEEYDVFMGKMIQEYIPNVTFIDGCLVEYPDHHRQFPGVVTGYAAKIWALYKVTSFRHVLLLDADSLPLVDPSTLFDLPEYTSIGFLAWPDYWEQLGADNAGNPAGAEIYTALKMPLPWETNPNHRMTESGQVLVDRQRCADVLEWLWFLNSYSDIVYKYLHGDKDTFFIAFHLANKANHFQQVVVAPREAVNSLSLPPEFPYRHQGMIQHTPNGKLAFHHRTAPDVKYFPGCGQNHLAEWCRVSYISTPLSPPQALQMLDKSHEGRFGLDEMDVHAPQTMRCSTPALVQHLATSLQDPAELFCKKTVTQVYPPYKRNRRGKLPIPIFPLAMYPASQLLERSFQLYQELKVELLKA